MVEDNNDALGKFLAFIPKTSLIPVASGATKKRKIVLTHPDVFLLVKRSGIENNIYTKPVNPVNL
jgi:hypothetical protein